MHRTTAVIGSLLASILVGACSASHGGLGTPGVDAGSGASDAASVVVDAGPPISDGHVPDGGGGEPDAGPPPAEDAGGARVCGTFGGAICGPAEYCEYGSPLCGGDDGGGVCAPRPRSCPDIYMPVCGCDRNTYSNACDAHAAGVSVATSGPCEMPPTDCRSTGCSDGMTCQLCWRDFACLPAGAVC